MHNPKLALALLAAIPVSAGTVTFQDSLGRYQAGTVVGSSDLIQFTGESNLYDGSIGTFSNLPIGTLTVNTSLFARRPFDSFTLPLVATYDLSPSYDNYVTSRTSLPNLEIFFTGDQYEIRYGGLCCVPQNVAPAYPLFVGSGSVPRPLLASGTVGDIATIVFDDIDLISRGVPEPATLGLMGAALAGLGLLRRRRA